MKLEDTIPMMLSDDYKERFRAEYWQTKIRYGRLHRMIVKHEAGVLNFTPDCPITVLQRQTLEMGQYLRMLEIRAEIEDIQLEAVEDAAAMQNRWVSAKDKLPPENEDVLCAVYGRPKEHIELIGAYLVGSWDCLEGWLINEYPGWHAADVKWWMPIPTSPPERPREMEDAN